MTREVQSAVLLMLGLVTLRLSWGTAYLNYVKESMRPWLLASGAVLVILGVLAAIDALRQYLRPDPGQADSARGLDEDVEPLGHGHHHGGPAVAWLLLVPVLTVFLIAPPALGAYAAARDTSNVAPAGGAVLEPMPPGDPVQVYLSDYVTRAVWEKGASLEGRTVELTGFVLPQPDGTWLLARMQINCCAADAFASKVQPVNLPSSMPVLPANTWLVITGKWVPGGGTDPETEIPLVKVETIRSIPQPENPYD